jgi:DMSO/TMAO reductase YedYZ molybdopterin-dependent catalytic subunit
MNRKLFVATFAASTLAACSSDAKSALTDKVRDQLGWAENLNRVVIGTRGNARVYSDADVDRVVRVNGLATPSDTRYADAMRDDWRAYRLPVDGLVDRPHTYTLAELRAMPQLAQATRHDCVEGWSVIGKWRGVPLATVLAMAQPKSTAKYVVFHCFDKDDDGTEYYESLGIHQAAHPQTLLALDLNDAPLDADHGAPVRLRVPTQLGYKSAKWVRRIELADAFPNTLLSKGGYWEDQGYGWYAGI